MAEHEEIQKAFKKSLLNLPDKIKTATDERILNHPPLFFLLCGAFLLFTVLIALVVFFIAVRGGEEVMVPDVKSKDITLALLELQKKELYPRIQLRYSMESKGSVIEQDPKAGTIVKAGRRIQLVISQGALISNVDSYTGRNIDEVRNELKTMFSSSSTPLISIKDPVLYQYSTEPSGTILEQSPEAGTGISGPIELNFMVSRGSETAAAIVPSVTGFNAGAAIELLDETGIRWVFAARQARQTGETGLIVAQEPAAGETILLDQPLRLTVAQPPDDTQNGLVSTLFSYMLPENPYPLQTVLDVIMPGGERKTLVKAHHYGGIFSYPCQVPAGSVLILSLLGREVCRETIEITP